MTHVFLVLCLSFLVYYSESLRLSWTSYPRNARNLLIPMYDELEEDYGFFRYPEKPTTSTETTEESRAKANRRIWMECMDETNVDPEYIIVLKYGTNSLWEKNFPTIKEWAHCVLTKKGLMTPYGVFQMDEARKALRKEDMEVAEQLIDKCLSAKKLPPQDLSWVYAKCHRYSKYRERLSAIGLF